MPKLEYTKYNFDFGRMQNSFAGYSTEEFFPKGVNFIEPTSPADFKRECFEKYPESYQEGMERGVSLVELLYKRIQNDTLSNIDAHDPLITEKTVMGRKSICYLVVGHAFAIDEAKYIFDFLEKDKTVAGSAFGNL